MTRNKGLHKSLRIEELSRSAIASLSGLMASSEGAFADYSYSIPLKVCIIMERNCIVNSLLVEKRSIL